jgi:flagellar protein FliO/FliZ
LSRLLALSLLAAEAPGDGTPPLEDLDYTGALLQVVVVLLAICLAFYVIIRWLLPRMARAAGGRGFRMGGGRLVRIVDRCPLEPKRTVFLVEVAGRFLLLGSSEGSITKLAGDDLDEAEIRRRIGAPPGRSFSDLIKNVGRGPRDAKPDA